MARSPDDGGLVHLVPPFTSQMASLFQKEELLLVTMKASSSAIEMLESWLCNTNLQIVARVLFCPMTYLFVHDFYFTKLIEKGRRLPCRFGKKNPGDLLSDC
jgi:hypothetical protein